ncbi:MAG: ABC transporter substrate-binding protein [Candidatus Promineifilaceae bacterium]
MKKSLFWIVSALLTLLVVACAAPEPQVIEKIVEVEVEKEVQVTVEVEKEVEKIVEKEVEVEVEVEKIIEVEVAAQLGNRGTLRIAHDLAWGGTENMDPVDTGRLMPAITQVYDALVIQGADGSPSPSLAASWSSNDSADVWTFDLRQGVTFHDGSDLTSADVAYSVEWWQGETSTISPVVEIIESIETPDDHTVVLNLAQPHADFPLLVMDYRARIIPVDSGDTIKDTGIGSGAYMLEKLDVEGTTILVANDSYWGGPPGVGRIEIIGIADSEAQLQAFLAGQLDWMDMTLAQSELADAQGGFNVISYPTGSWTGLIMRTDIAPFDNVALRRAMRVVADRQAMVDIALSGAGIVACDTPVKPDDQYRFDTDCSPNPELATELLAEAGYDGETITLHISDVCSDWTPLAELYQQQLGEIGVDLDIKVVPSDGYWTDAWMVEPFSATCWGERQADQILNEAYRSGGPWNETYWNRDDYDAMLDAARQELDFDARKAHYVAAQELLWEEGGALIPYHGANFRATTPCVIDVPAAYFFAVNWADIGITPGCGGGE